MVAHHCNIRKNGFPGIRNFLRGGRKGLQVHIYGKRVFVMSENRKGKQDEKEGSTKKMVKGHRRRI